MAEIEKGTTVESIYLENRTTRKAFYLVEINKTPKQYQVVVKWGRLGTDGQEESKGKYASLDTARVKMNTIAEAKKLRNYQVAKKPKASEKVKLAQLQEFNSKNDEMIRFADLE